MMKNLGEAYHRFYTGVIEERGDGFVFIDREKGRVIDMEDFVPDTALVGPLVVLDRLERGVWTAVMGVHPAGELEVRRAEAAEQRRKAEWMKRSGRC